MTHEQPNFGDAKPKQFASMRGMLFNQDGQVIALRRCGGEQAGLWELPGGKAEGNELPAQTISRECGEEVGENYAVTLFENEFYSLGSRTFTTKNGQRRTIHPSVMFGVVGNVEPVLDPSEHDGARLISPFEIVANQEEFTIDALAAAQLWIHKTDLH